MSISNEQLTKWAEHLNAESLAVQKAGQIGGEEYHSMAMNVVKTLFEVQDTFIRGGRFKETWDEGSFQLHPFSTVVIRKATKLDAVFSLASDIDGIELHTSLKCDLLGNVDDNFWRLLLTLSEYGKVIAPSSERSQHPLAKENPRLFRPKGLVYQLMRDHLFSVLTREGDWSSFSLTVKWAKEAYSLNDVVLKGAKAFRALYGLQYALWKARNNNRKDSERSVPRRPASSGAN